MVVVEVRDEEFVDVAQGDAELPKALGSTAAGIEQHPMLTGLNEEYGKPRPATRAQRRRLLRKLERVARKQRLHRPVTMSPRP